MSVCQHQGKEHHLHAGSELQVQVSSCIHRSSPVWKYWEPWGPFSASSNTNLGDAKPNHLPNPSWGWPWIAPNHSICVPRPVLTEQQTQATPCGRSVRYIIRQSSSRWRKERSYSQLHIKRWESRGTQRESILLCTTFHVFLRIPFILESQESHHYS